VNTSDPKGKPRRRRTAVIRVRVSAAERAQIVERKAREGARTYRDMLLGERDRASKRRGVDQRSLAELSGVFVALELVLRGLNEISARLLELTGRLRELERERSSVAAGEIRTVLGAIQREMYKVDTVTSRVELTLARPLGMLSALIARLLGKAS